MARSTSTNLNWKESHDAANTGRACRTAASRIQRVQSRMDIRLVKSSEYSHYPPNLDDSYVNPLVNVIARDLAGLRLGLWFRIMICQRLRLYRGRWVRSLRSLHVRGDYSQLASKYIWLSATIVPLYVL